MSSITFARCLKATLLALIVSAAVTGCSKKQEKPVAVVPPADAETVAAPTPATTPAAPVATIQASTDIRQSFADADAALKARAYEKAAQNLLAVQKQKQLTQQQSEEARNRMVSLQASLAQAIANGDPNAKAAGELLHQAAMVK